MHPAREISIGNFRIGGNQPLVLIAGPCVIESEAHAVMMAERLAEIASHAKMPLVFKASYDKANRSSEQSFRGPGLKEGLRILQKIKQRFGLPILTDIHEVSHAAAAAEVADVLQILSKSCCRHALFSHSAQDGLPGCFRRNALGAAAGRGGEVERRAAGIY